MQATMQQAYNVMGIASGPQLVASTEKVDIWRLWQLHRQVEASIKEARHEHKVACAKKVDVSDYAPGAF